MKKLYTTLLLLGIALGSFAQTLDVVSHYPAQNELAVPQDTVITVKFNDQVDPATVNDIAFVVHGTFTRNLSISFSYNSSDNIGIFRLNSIIVFIINPRT